MLCETRRLIIREWRKGDVADNFEFASDGTVAKYLTWPPSTDIKQSKKYVKRNRKLYRKYFSKKGIVYGGSFAIELKSEQKVIGVIFISRPYAVNRIAEISYAVNQKYWGNGFATEAVKGVLKYIKQNRVAERIQAHHDTDNGASGTVLKKAGMKLEGVLRKLSDNNTNKSSNQAIYSILIEEIE